MSKRFILPAFVVAAVLGTVGYLSSPTLVPHAMAETSSTTTSTAALNNVSPAAGLSASVKVAEFGGETITKSDVEDLYQAIKARAGDQAPPLDDIFWMLVDQIISSRLIIQQANAEHLDLSPEVVSAIQTAREQIIQEAYIRKLFSTLDNDETLRPYYDKYVASFKGQEEVHARHILVETEDQAKDIINKLKAGAKFEDLAKSASQDPGSKDNGGDLGFFPKEAMVPEFGNAAFAMKAGEVSQVPVKTQFGWHVIKLEERRPRVAPTFEEAKPQLMMEAQQEILQKQIEELRSKAEIKMFDGDELPQRPAQTQTPVSATGK